MKAKFLDCNDDLGGVFDKVFRPGQDFPVEVNRQARITPEELPRLLDGYAIAIDDHSYIPTEWAKKCPSLKHVVFLGTGAASYMNIAELKALGIAVHIIKGYGDTAVAEHAFALMWAAARQIPLQDRRLRAGTWAPLPGPQLTGKSLGLVGLGGIGAEMARLCAGMGMKVQAWNRSPKEMAGVKMVELDTLLATSDVVSVHLLLSDETRGILSAEKIAKLKDGAIVVNTARGALFDEPALVAALQSGRISAGLDVFEKEPLAPDHPLTQLDNVVITAHSAFRTPEASETLIRRALDIVNGLAG